MSASSYVGTILPQFTVLEGAKVFVNGVDVTPTTLGQTPPRKIGRNGQGRPFYQGTYTFTLRYTEQTLDEYQRLTSIFYPAIGSEDGPIVDVVLPWIDQAGRFVEGTAYLEWPEVSQVGALIEGVTVLLTSFKLVGEEF